MGVFDCVETCKFTITPFRIFVERITFFLPPSDVPSSWGIFQNLPAALKLYARGTLIPGGLTATDFGVPFGPGPGQSTFSESNDFVMSWGVMIDLGELLRPR